MPWRRHPHGAMRAGQPRSRLTVLHNDAVSHFDDPLGMGGNVRCVGHRHDCHSRRSQAIEELQKSSGRYGVETSGGLIRKKFWACWPGPCDRHTLTFPTREFCRGVVFAATEVESPPEVPRTTLSLPGRHAEAKRLGAPRWRGRTVEVEGCGTETPGRLPFGGSRSDRAYGPGRVPLPSPNPRWGSRWRPKGKRQKCRLTAARRTGDGHRLPVDHGKVDAGEGVDLARIDVGHSLHVDCDEPVTHS